MADTASAVPSTMKAAVYEEYGEAEVIQIKEVPVPAYGPKDVVIKTAAAAVNPVDYKLRFGYIKGWPQKLPIITGWDVAGEVVHVGEECKRIKVGDQVFSYNRPAWDVDKDEGLVIGERGAAAEYVPVREWKVAVAPKEISLEEASSIPLVGLTAWQGLFDHAKVSDGQTVLVNGASGGVGSFAVQFLAARGNKVIGTCSDKNVEFVTNLGAIAVSYTGKSVEELAEAVKAANDGNHVDAAYDAVGGDSTKMAILATKPEGGVTVSIANYTLDEILKGLGDDAGTRTATGFLVKPSNEQLSEIAALVDAKKVKVGKLTIKPLSKIVEAHKASESGRTVGKITLVV